MSPALTLLDFMDTDSGLPLYRLDEDFSVFISGVASVKVVSGYETDLASVPRFVGWLYQAADLKPRAAALIHDWLYSAQGGARFPIYPGSTVAGTVRLSRRQCDDALRTLMLANGCSVVRANLYYAAVRLFGRRAWNSPA